MAFRKQVIKAAATRYPTLEAWREAANLSQMEAAKLLGISQTYYGRLERGEQVAVREKARNIMAKTGVPVEVLVGLS